MFFLPQFCWESDMNPTLQKSVLVLGLVSILSAAGCGGGTSPAEPSRSSDAAQALSGKDQLRERLTMIAESGSGGSAVSGMRAGLDQLKTTEAALAADLLKDVDALEKLQDAERIKALAKKMIEKLK
jgi:hypothetical protein